MVHSATTNHHSRGLFRENLRKPGGARNYAVARELAHLSPGGLPLPVSVMAPRAGQMSKWTPWARGSEVDQLMVLVWRRM